MPGSIAATGARELRSERSSTSSVWCGVRAAVRRARRAYLGPRGGAALPGARGAAHRGAVGAARAAVWASACGGAVGHTYARTRARPTVVAATRQTARARAGALVQQTAMSGGLGCDAPFESVLNSELCVSHASF